MSITLEEKIKILLNQKLKIASNKILTIKVNNNEVYIVIRDNDNIKMQTIHIKNELVATFPNYNINIAFTEDSPQASNQLKPSNIKKIYTISACKGGVGKSSITSMIAMSLSQNLKVGIVDADIYGPSIPSIFGINKKANINNNLIVPLISNNIEIISMGNLIDQEKAAIWRGPMISKAIYQLINQTSWSDLDILLIDMPPGTGDIALSLYKNFDINGTFLVTTPEKLSLEETTRNIFFYQKINLPIIGVIANMSYYLDSKNEKKYIFGNNNIQEYCHLHNLNLCSEIPLIEGLNERIFSEHKNYFNPLEILKLLT